MVKNRIFSGIASLVGVVAVSSVALASEPHVAPMTEFANSTVAEWVKSDLVVNAVKAQNAKNAAVTQDEIDSLDKAWRAQTGASERPLIDEVLGNDLSGYLAGKREESGGLVTEIFVMDNKGLNVGQSDVTSDYWQGDEAKWQKTYGAGPGAIFIDEVEMDESTQTFQSQLSMSIVDPATGEVIGAITVGVNIDAL